MALPYIFDLCAQPCRPHDLISNFMYCSAPSKISSLCFFENRFIFGPFRIHNYKPEDNLHLSISMYNTLSGNKRKVKILKNMSRSV